MRKPPVLTRLGRLFVIKTRWEAWAVTWAIALGAVERGKTYLATYPGTLGWVFFILCCGVVFLAGAKLLDSVRAAPAVSPAPVRKTPVRRVRQITRSRHGTARGATASGRSPPARRSD